jgi:hypothetical protein
LKDNEQKILDLKDQLAGHKKEKVQRTKQQKPIIMVTKKIASNKFQLNKHQTRILKLKRGIKTFNSQKNRLLDAKKRKIVLIEKQYVSVKEEIFKEIKPELTFEETLELFVPICKANIQLKYGETQKKIQLKWNGYNGKRISSFSCYECKTPLNNFSPLNICNICLEFICDKDKKRCSDCGKTICNQHFWLCHSNNLHCISEIQFKCQECETLLCANCKQTCKVCNRVICSDHINFCSKCKNSICKEHKWDCEICAKTFCSEEESNKCYEGNHLFCNDCKQTCSKCNENLCKKHSIKCFTCQKTLCKKEDHFKTCTICGETLCNSCTRICKGCNKLFCQNHLTKCSNCGSLICDSCIRTDEKFFGLIKKQKCKVCIE